MSFDLLNKLENIVKETYNCEFRIAIIRNEWNIYIVKTKTIFVGTFNEVISLAIEEFESYRVIAPTKKHIKNYKKFTYK